ncbi:MAG: hypothetical protein HY216_07005 [Candidatus Rokubacteria bacterium]|nr:hypothetical protein [Candidatus Rokubacteria bacterium]
MYLGDGYISRMRRTFVLRVFLHRDQQTIIRQVSESIQALLPRNRVGLVRHGAAVLVVTCYSNAWPVLFPQHGPGLKHSRSIVLEPWQRSIVEEYPAEFVRGCLESDGSRHRRIVGGRNYPAYSFGNRSEDILTLFVWACGLLGVRARRANRVNISIARRPDVATLDRVVEYDGLDHGPPTLREPAAPYRTPVLFVTHDVADGTPDAARRLERVLTTDPDSGIMRHADAGYPEAIDAAKRQGLDLPDITT